MALPGIGIFTSERRSAKLRAFKVFEPPVYIIVFKAAPDEGDKKLYSFISTEKGIDEVEAIKELSDFTYRLKQKINKEGSCVLPGIGTLIKQDAGELSFESSADLQQYFAGATVERVAQKDAARKVVDTDFEKPVAELQDEVLPETGGVILEKKKDYWWVFALILAVIAIWAIVYYYMVNGSLG